MAVAVRAFVYLGATRAYVRRRAHSAVYTRFYNTFRQTDNVRNKSVDVSHARRKSQVRYGY